MRGRPPLGFGWGLGSTFWKWGHKGSGILQLVSTGLSGFSLMTNIYSTKSGIRIGTYANTGFSVTHTVFGMPKSLCSTGTKIGVRLPQHSPFAIGKNMHYDTTQH
jgi:hypothetical protein